MSVQWGDEKDLIEEAVETCPVEAREPLPLTCGARGPEPRLTAAGCPRAAAGDILRETKGTGAA